MHGTIDSAENINLKAARDTAQSMPLAQFNPGDPELFRSDACWPYFDRLRRRASTPAASNTPRTM